MNVYFWMNCVHFKYLPTCLYILLTGKTRLVSPKTYMENMHSFNKFPTNPWNDLSKFRFLKGLGSWFRSLGTFYEGSQVILRSNKNKNLQASSFVISVCIRIFRMRRKRAFSLRGIICVNYARRRLVYEANL